MRRRPVLASTVLAAALVLAGCGASEPESSLPTASGEFGDKPEITFPDAEPPAELTTDVISEGDGAEVAPTDLIVADYLGQVWDGEVFDNSYDAKGEAEPTPLTIPLSQLVPGWAKGLEGVKVGSRVMLSLPPEEGYGEEGNEQAGIKGTDTIVFVVDVLNSYSADASAQADAVPDAAAAASVAPQVTGELGSVATVTVPAGSPEPTEVVTTVLAEGTGEPVAEGQLIAQYSGVDWTGSSIGSSWEDKTPQAFPVSPDEPTFAGLVGVPLGSRVLLQIPSAEASPAIAVVIDLIDQP
ncbi:FKBP-type peptidyl-prolyl cis-trans isomerase [Cellulomonas sp. NPDC055163]